MPRSHFERPNVRTIFWRRFFEWFLELLVLGLLPWLAHLIVSEDSHNLWQLPELYLFVMVIGVTSVFDTLKDKKTLDSTKPLAAVTGVLAAVLAPAAYARLSLSATNVQFQPPTTHILEHVVFLPIIVALAAYSIYRIPLIAAEATMEAEASEADSTRKEAFR